MESLLAADAPENVLLQAAVSQAAEQLPDVPEEEGGIVGSRIGRYLITGLIGKGGMGAVYRASRNDDFRMQVAIKLLKRGTDTDAALSRFRAERQILAGLQHPNIAHLLDGGATETGLPYLVMEYVEGTQLLEYAATRSVDERLRLFLTVCSAVQYAHEHNVIHRDIKPTNILVSDSGVPKLLDFGIAKLLAEDGDAVTGLTRPEAPRWITPEYASPEHLRGEPIGAATDIYSLGALLYELLTGQRAHQPASLSVADVHNEVFTRVPKRPSVIIPRLDRDLDRVVMKALAKAPEARYRTVQEFSDDVERFLQGLPIRARRPSLLYRGRRFFKRHRVTFVAASLTAAAIAAVMGTVAYFVLDRRPILTQRDSIVVADVSNTTGNPIFNDALRQALFVKLAESPYINTLTDEQVNRTLRLMRRKADERLTVELAREICLRNAAKAVVFGSISQLAGQYVLGLEAINCATGESLVRTGTQAQGIAGVLPALGRSATQFRRKLGESLASVERFDKPFEATSSSLEALQAYALAKRARQEGRRGDQLGLLKRAIELDPNFAYAYASLSAEYSNLKDTAKAYEYGRRAFELRDRVTEREKFYLLDRYYGAVTGELDERIKSARLWSLTYPQDYLAYAGLSTAYGHAGQVENALAATLEVLRLNPDGATTSWVNAMGYYAALDRVDDAIRTYKEAQRRGVLYSHLAVYYYPIAFLRGDTAGMAEAIQSAMQRDGGAYEILIEQALTASFSGRVTESSQFLERAIDSAGADRSRRARAFATRAHIESLFGMHDRARQDAKDAVKLAADREVLALAGWSLARAGDRISAEAAANSLKKRYPLHTLVNRVYEPAIRAEIAKHAEKPGAAIEILAIATPYELAPSGLTMTMYPVYVRAEAALQAGQAATAISEFQRIVDRPGLVSNAPIASLARLGSARAYALAGDRSNSCSAYRRLFGVWNNADKQSAVVRQAIREQTVNCTHH